MRSPGKSDSSARERVTSSVSPFRWSDRTRSAPVSSASTVSVKISCVSKCRYRSDWLSDSPKGAESDPFCSPVSIRSSSPVRR
ncbi:hypothetical protein NXX28_14905 [Bacteroides fragilis]|nr:hypothetical protein [Bacteroides fragilis]UVO59944.1 hypothetical protein NXW10_17660 [Bacteroides fragilis]UVO81084.1 hypothetical protein NXX28_14905 [Bacteroides fragilis]UVP97144.1 hypothetical protein NXX30_15915 [Bacteroides fragilis]